MTQQEMDLIIRLEAIFMPHFRKQRDAAREKGPVKEQLRLVHYTSADAALNIIKTKRVWMRNGGC